MSDYCGNCRYKVREKVGPDACPFNYLYWDFIARHEETLRGNPRLGPVFSTWKRMKPEMKKDIAESAASFLSKLT